MIRIVLFLLLITALSLAGSWVLEHNGTLAVDWLGYRIEASLFFVMVSILTAFILALVLAVGILWLRAAPHRLKYYYTDLRREKGLTALTQGFAAIAAGDVASAKQLSKTAEHKLGKTPLTLLLHTQTAQLAGNEVETSQYLSYLLQNKETELIGLKGMLLEAQKKGDFTKAANLAERAYALNPDATWIAPVLIELHIRSKAWAKARTLLEREMRKRPVHNARLTRHLGLVLLAEAAELENHGDTRQALGLAHRAHRLLPGFIPATLTLARLLLARGKRRKAAKLLQHAWNAAPHADIARLYLESFPHASVEKKLKLLESFTASHPDNVEANLLLATQALKACDFVKTRIYAEDALKQHPTAAAYTLMYKLEKAMHPHSSEALQQWLDRAANAPRDPAWLCGACGYSSPLGWEAVCSNCHGIDLYRWEEAAKAHVMRE